VRQILKLNPKFPNTWEAEAKLGNVSKNYKSVSDAGFRTAFSTRRYGEAYRAARCDPIARPRTTGLGVHFLVLEVTVKVFGCPYCGQTYFDPASSGNSLQSFQVFPAHCVPRIDNNKAEGNNRNCLHPMATFCVAIRGQELNHDKHRIRGAYTSLHN
jgi:hypothetical protein